MEAQIQFEYSYQNYRTLMGSGPELMNINGFQTRTNQNEWLPDQNYWKLMKKMSSGPELIKIYGFWTKIYGNVLTLMASRFNFVESIEHVGIWTNLMEVNENDRLPDQNQ